jgi:hypothetical protein
MKKKKSWKKVDIEVGRYDSKFKKKSYEPRTHHQRDENNSEESERHVKSFHQRRFDEEQTRRPNDGSEKPGYRDKTGKDQAYV